MTPKINYADLYDYLCEEVAQHGECNGQGDCTYDFVYDAESVGLCGTVHAKFRYVDDTFSHAFGVETCKHRKRFKLNEYSNKVVQCCDLQRRHRSNSGYKTIKVTDIACGFYEPKVEGGEQ